MQSDLTSTPDEVNASRQLADQLSLTGGFAFAALTAEPNTGVGVVNSLGQVIYLNEQGAKILHGSSATAKEYIGRFWHDHMPAEWVRERLRVLSMIAITGKPVLMRTIWRDHQQFTWIYPIDRSTMEEGGDHPDADALPPPDLFLTITRRVASDEEAEQLMPSNDHIEEVDSGLMRLRALDSLSPRELQVLALLGQGLSMGETARVLRLSEKTVDNHRNAIHQRLGVHERSSLVKIAARAGLCLADADRKRV
jgi:DNA-binding CsgD family transcriptional regulator